MTIRRLVQFSGIRAFVNSISKLQSSTMTNDSWKGVPLAEIYGSQSPWGAPEFPLVSPSFNHAVLYHIPSSGSITSEAPPRPQVSQDKWDHDHVRMPCSSKSLYPVDDNNGETLLKKRWEIIEEVLSKPIKNSKELADAIISYNIKFKNTWRFRALHQLFEEYLEEEESQYFFDETLPKIVKLALSLPKLIQAPIPLLKIHKNRSVSLSQQQAACLLANAFFCTFPRRNTFKNTSEYASYPHINFNSLYESYGSQSTLEKLKCLCHYFRRVCTKVPVGVLTFSRRSMPRENCPKWSECDASIATLPLHVDSSLYIEDAHGLIQMDFANKFLGGGVLNHGSVQEEIRFVICPELMISMLITEVMRPDEALMMIGSERYSTYTGYGGSFQWAGDYLDQTPYDSSGRRRCAVLALDAIRYANVAHQYTRDKINRELNKAWIGFSFYTDDSSSSSLNYPGIATGNWGCGAFGGSPELKSLIQMMACVRARRPMAYCTFQDLELRDELAAVYELLIKYNVTVGQLYGIILKYSTSSNVRKADLFAFLHQALRDREKELSRTVDEAMEPNFQDTSEPKAEKTSLSNTEEALNVSPDLFSEDFERLSGTDQNLDKESEIIKNDATIDERHSRNKKASRLFEELDKQDEENGMLNVDKSHKSSITQTKVHVVNEINQRTDHQSGSDNKRVCRVSLFDELQKFDHENGKLNLNSPHKNNSILNNKSYNEIDTEPETECPDAEVTAKRNTNEDVKRSSIDGAAIQNEISPELKKKLSRKITDYFCKKS